MTPRSPKTTADGHRLLNLACGTRTHAEWNNVDFSPYTRLAGRPLLVRALRAAGLLSGERLARLKALDPALICWDLRRGIPFADDSLDLVYHSHFLEHLDRSAALPFLRECRRVLRPGGLIRVVVPDLHFLVEQYRSTFSTADNGGFQRHQASIEEIFDQMVRVEPVGTSHQRGFARRIERLVRGDADKTGERHRWMYDRHTLAALLSDAGFRDLRVESATTSRLPNFARYHLDAEPDGTIYKRESLFMEGAK